MTEDKLKSESEADTGLFASDVERSVMHGIIYMRNDGDDFVELTSSDDFEGEKYIKVSHLIEAVDRAHKMIDKSYAECKADTGCEYLRGHADRLRWLGEQLHKA